MFTWVAKTTGYGWEQGIGDPSFFAWLTVLCHVIATVISLRAFGQSRRLSLKQSWYWLLLAILLLGLGINKQLDLQTLFTETARQIARRDGWYGDRRELQRLFVFSVAAMGAFFLCALSVGVLCWARRLWLSLLGVVFTYE